MTPANAAKDFALALVYVESCSTAARDHRIQQCEDSGTETDQVSHSRAAGSINAMARPNSLIGQPQRIERRSPRITCSFDHDDHVRDHGGGLGPETIV
jgi:hypothetical protein